MSSLSLPTPLFDTLEHLTLSHRSVSDCPDQQRDFECAAVFLWQYRGSEGTYNTYRRDVERLLQWAWLVAGKTLPEIGRDDLEAFLEFCRTPPPAWIASRHHRRFIQQQGVRQPNPSWRPFVARVEGQHLSPSSFQSLISVLSTFFQFLFQERVIASNPVSLLRQKSKFVQSGSEPIRRLSDTQWQFVLSSAHALADEDPEQHERTLFIMVLLYGLYCRISELTATQRWQPSMGDFTRDHHGHWWFVTVGKGHKKRHIAVSDAVLEALKRYRRHLKLPDLPMVGENTPLLPKTKGQGPITSTRRIRSLVQLCFDHALERLKEAQWHDEAILLQQATVHWLRHTGISDDVKRRPREHVRDDAGHRSGATTDRYVDVHRQDRARTAKHKTLDGE